MLEQQVQQVQQQLQLVEQNITELTSLNFGLEELKGSKDKEILAPLGRGIFVKTKLLSEELTVDIGSKTFVKKNIEKTKKLIEEQIEKLEEIREQLALSLNEINEEASRLIEEAQKEEFNKKK